MPEEELPGGRRDTTTKTRKKKERDRNTGRARDVSQGSTVLSAKKLKGKRMGDCKGNFEDKTT